MTVIGAANRGTKFLARSTGVKVAQFNALAGVLETLLTTPSQQPVSKQNSPTTYKLARFFTLG